MKKASLPALAIAAAGVSACELVWGIGETSPSDLVSMSGGQGGWPAEAGRVGGGAASGGTRITGGSGQAGGPTAGTKGGATNGSQGGAGGTESGAAGTGGSSSSDADSGAGGVAGGRAGSNSDSGAGGAAGCAGQHTAGGSREPGGGGGGQAGAEAGSGGIGGGGGEGGAGGEHASPCGPPLAGMVCIPGATFVMGSQVAGATYHEVTLRTFQIMAFEVTVAQYDECVDASACSPAGVRIPGDEFTSKCNAGILGRKNHPINCVTAHEAEAYCAWVGQRMLTEEEWEYAALRGGIRWFPWGNEAPNWQRLNLAGDEFWGEASDWGDDGFAGTAPVGSFPLGATEDGIFDLGGNVWEMVSSGFCPHPSTPCNNCPRGESCSNACNEGCLNPSRVHRGGSWAEHSSFAWEVNGSWVTWRGDAWPDFAISYSGFRCARSVPERNE